MHIDESRHYGVPAGIQHFGPFGDGYGRPGADLQYSIAVDQHRGVFDYGSARAVNEIPSNYCQHDRPLTFAERAVNKAIRQRRRQVAAVERC